ncbi:MAG: glycosyltransferase family 4 protein [Flammeovirgaceae bacterium]|nr:MAG: glycosyltransferase family 4 protein [Flammeovirgaceae bacterium]
MTILILHQFFNTPQHGGSLRSYYLANALQDAGHKVVVITTHNQANELVEEAEGIEIHYLPVAYSNHYGFFKRIYSFIQFVLRIVNKAGQFKNADVCYAISAPLTTGLAAIWIKRRYTIPYYFEVGDLWPEAPIQVGIVRNYFLKRLLYRLEASIYKRAVIVVALSAAIKQNILQRFPMLTVQVIPNMADTEFFKHAHKNQELQKAFDVSGRFVIAYIGTLGLANGLHYMLDCAAATLQEKLPVSFLLCGDGAMREELRHSAKVRNLSNVRFIPHQNREGVNAIINVTDAVFVSYLPLPVLETGSPNKYFDGLAAGKLIVVNTGGWMKGEVEHEQCGIAVDPNDARDFVKKITPFVRDSGLLAAYQARARQLAETSYSRQILGRAFTGLFEKL